MTAAEVELERARRMFAQKVDRLRKAFERFKKSRDESDAAMRNVFAEMINALAAAEDLQDGKEQQ